ncbi:hypothetical protein E4U21_002635 [Claviceps maximensis]|nr:hypothetical protein E4U21_002635 [Claviceps maximensis]
MVKLSPSLKALINASFARPGPVPASAAIRQAAATFTLNSHEALPILYRIASAGQDQESQIQTAEFMREIGLKCISFNGIPRTINCLNAFHAALPKHVASCLKTRPSRMLTPANLDHVATSGRQLWDDVYAPFEEKLLDKLAQAHPDLPVHILSCHYGPLLSDPAPSPAPAATAERCGSLVRMERVVTSVMAISCLRAQTGAGPQVVSHALGLKKIFQHNDTCATDDDDEGSAEGKDALTWLAGDEGLEWILKSVDAIVRALGGSNFAPLPEGPKL